MIKRVQRCFSERYKLHLYDYRKQDPRNPRQLISDDALPSANETNMSSTAVALWLYAVGGSIVYFASRLMYDTEWDRFYHIYYPASMEYFDVLSVYYAKRMKALAEGLPTQWKDVLPTAVTAPAYRRWQTLSQTPEIKKEEEDLVSSILSTAEQAESIPSKLAPTDKS